MNECHTICSLKASERACFLFFHWSIEEKALNQLVISFWESHNSASHLPLRTSQRKKEKRSKKKSILLLLLLLLIQVIVVGWYARCVCAQAHHSMIIQVIIQTTKKRKENIYLEAVTFFWATSCRTCLSSLDPNLIKLME